ncbi:MAG: ABC transporter ATP-binding protein/permease [Chloroflexota bacterium]|nr:ABC transporter ATP-binding protein/permease [Chloroflexota bacterium]
MRMPLKRYQALLITYLKPQRFRVLSLAVLLLSSIGLQLVNPQILRAFIDSATAGGALRTLTGIAVLFLGVALIGQVLSVAANYLGENVGWTATNRLRADLALHCLELDMSFHNARNPGELIERIDGDVAALGGFFSRFVVDVLGNALLLLGTLILLFRIDWRVGVVMTIFAIVALLVVNSLRDLAVPHWTAAREASAQLFSFLEERVSGTEDVRSSGANAYVMRHLHERARELLRKQRKAGLMGTATGSTAIILFTLGTALAFVLGAYLFRAGAITIGTAYLIFNYTELLRQPIEQITRQMQDLQQATASMARIQDLFNIQSSIQDGNGTDLPPGPLPVEMEHVSFGYVAEEPVLRDIQFRLAPGTVLGLLGRTGSGKTTLTRLLLRLGPVRK